MGYALMVGPCFVCEQLMTYNPLRVPSVKVGPDGQPSETGTREPLCRTCVEAGNVLREQHGLDPIEPHPDAYEPVDEMELP